MNDTLEFYREINEGKFESERAIKHRQRVRELLMYSKNKDIEDKVKEQLPRIKYTSKLVDQLKFAAKEVSKRFKKPTELIGVLAGQEKGRDLYATSYHVFQDQECNCVNTKANDTGRIKTYRDLKQKKIKVIDVAHSHHRMGVFHSSLDDKLLEIESRISDRGFLLSALGETLVVSYSVSTVFNERGELFSKGGIMIPRLTETGFQRKYVTFKPEMEVKEYGHFSELDKERLRDEINTNVTYSMNINNNGFKGEF